MFDNCGFSSRLPIGLMSVGSFLAAALLVLGIAVPDRYMLTGSRTGRPSAP